MDAMTGTGLEEQKLLSIDISLTDACNLKCRHCGAYSHRENGCSPPAPPPLDKREYFDIIRQAAQMGTHLIIFSGGEPMLNPDLWEILEYADDAGPTFCLLSNGSLIDEDAARQFSRFRNLAYIRLSLDYAAGKKFEDHREFENGYEKILGVTRRLTGAGVNVGIGMTIFPDNIGDVEEMAVVARENGAGYFRAVPVMPIGKARTWDIDRDFYTRCVNTMLRLRNRRDSSDFGVISMSPQLREEYRHFLYECPGAAQGLSVSASGHVSLCALTDFGMDLPTVREESLAGIRQMLYDKKLTYYRDAESDKNSECSGCQFFSQCRGGCIAETVARQDLTGDHPRKDQPRKDQPMCIKKIWPAVLKELAREKKLRKTVNNLIIDKMTRERNHMLFTCYRSLPFWLFYGQPGASARPQETPVQPVPGNHRRNTP